MTSNIENMKYQELIDLQKQIGQLIELRKTEEKNKLVQHFNELAEASGFSINELLGNAVGKQGGKKRAPSSVSYVNPNDSTQTWTGRGRKPQWIKDAVASGKSLDNFKA